jgi:hypothetical protein
MRLGINKLEKLMQFTLICFNICNLFLNFQPLGEVGKYLQPIEVVDGFQFVTSLDETESAVHLYVVRRVLDGVGIPRVRQAAHSGVLLESKSGKWYLLEFMSDAKTHLTKVEPLIKQEREDHVILIMEGRTATGTSTFEWTRQKAGVRLNQQQTIAQLKEMMQDGMKGYSVWKQEHCHTAQERLRERLGVLNGNPVWDDDPFVVATGQLTFDAEGQEGGRFHSRVPHVPSNFSGLTIGRGYDLSQWKTLDVTTTLRKAGLNEEAVLAYAGAVGLKGAEARACLEANRERLTEITPEQQKRLFEIVYAFMEGDVKRICGNQRVVETYGMTDWEQLNPKIKEVLIDLRFRGDYTPATRQFLQSHVAKNDLGVFSKEIKDRSRWPNVPQDRFDRRARYLSD